MLFLVGCGTIKEGFSNQKKISSDEFLVEKKSPLIMPPNYNELPIPKEDKNKNSSQEKNIKNLITDKNAVDTNIDSMKETNQNFEEFLIKKIKKN